MNLLPSSPIVILLTSFSFLLLGRFFPLGSLIAKIKRRQISFKESSFGFNQFDLKPIEKLLLLWEKGDLFRPYVYLYQAANIGLRTIDFLHRRIRLFLQRDNVLLTSDEAYKIGSIYQELVDTLKRGCVEHIRMQISDLIEQLFQSKETFHEFLSVSRIIGYFRSHNDHKKSDK